MNRGKSRPAFFFRQFGERFPTLQLLWCHQAFEHLMQLVPFVHRASECEEKRWQPSFAIVDTCRGCLSFDLIHHALQVSSHAHALAERAWNVLRHNDHSFDKGSPCFLVCQHLRGEITIFRLLSVIHMPHLAGTHPQHSIECPIPKALVPHGPMITP